jgi:hypothetical protein
MIDRRIGKIKIRRGTDQERKTIIFSEAELLYTTDTKRVFVGDGTTSGGIVISNKNFVVTSITPLPSNALYCDIIHNISDSTTYIVGSAGDGSLSAILICDVECCKKLQKDIDEVKSGINDVLRLVNGLQKPPEPEVDPAPLIFVIQPTSQYVNYGDTATFTASATGPGTITYQWYNISTNTLIPGAITNILTIPNIGVPNVGNYRCVATSSLLGSISSNIAELSVDSRLILANPNREYILSNPNNFYIQWTELEITGLLLEDPTGDFLYTNDGAYIQLG